MKKIIALVLSVVMVLALAACGGQKAANMPAADTEDNAEAATIKVALLLSGSRGDGAYLDYVCAGADKAAAELPIELKVLEIADAADYESNLVAMADAGYDVIIGRVHIVYRNYLWYKRYDFFYLKDKFYWRCQSRFT